MTDAQLDTMCAFIAEHEGAMFALLETLVRINSHTPNRAGVNRVGAVMRGVFEGMGFGVRMVDGGARGDILVASNAACEAGADGRQVLVSGHMDTVFPPGEFETMEHRAHGIVGPGVIDMKGGLVAAVYALGALDHAGLLADIPVRVVLNADEEIGSPDSRALIEAEARRSAFAMVFECGGLRGEIVTGRKGRTPFRIESSGRGGHAGAQGQDKPSAILELARRIVEVEALNDVERGMSVNVGVIEGGTGPNVVARQAVAIAEARYMSEVDGGELRDALLRLFERPGLPGTRSRLLLQQGRPAMDQTPGNEALFGVVADVAARLGLPIGEEFRGGVSDANFIAAVGCPVLDGMGPSGDRDHSHDEYMIPTSLAERATLAAGTIAESWRLFAEGGLFLSDAQDDA